jgi:5-methylthioadenosine/S-adenosylhomocysteine deaminase
MNDTILFSNIDYLTPDFHIAHGYVQVEGTQITYVGARPPVAAAGEGAQPPALPIEVVDGCGKLLMPGLYNLHTHVPMTLLRGYAEGLPLQAWLNDKVFPFEALIQPQDAYFATQLAVAEMLRFGTVSFSDMYGFGRERARVVRESGIKANLCNGITVFEDRPYQDTHYYAADTELIAAAQADPSGRLRAELNIHAEYTNPPQVIRQVGERAQELGLRTHIHLSETKAEHEECKARHDGQTPAQLFEALGFFETPCTCAHCVWLEPGDVDILARHGATVACNPASNLKLASGIAPVGEFLQAGLNVALGTDGVASNNSHNLFKELYLFSILYKAQSGDPTTVTPAQALAAATTAGAWAQGREHCAQIAPGAAADFILLDVDQPWMQPQTSLLNNLVYSAQGSDVLLTMVDGRILYDRRGLDPADPAAYKTIDLERATAETSAATRRILAGL